MATTPKYQHPKNPACPGAVAAQSLIGYASILWKVAPWMNY